MKDNKAMSGTVFNIQHYCIHDGPGIRTNVFLKGCPLECLWCQNPESQSIHRQIMFNTEACNGCGNCVSRCPESAIAIIEGKATTNRERCRSCGKCVEICRRDAREFAGKKMTAEEVLTEVQKDKMFYDSSGGGVTITGGEPFVQYSFSERILRLCKGVNINTAIETCGFAKWDIVELVLKNVDLVLYDVKHMDSEAHKKGTGVGNERILDNMKKISKNLKLPIIARVPIVPGYNDSAENMDSIGKFLKEEIPTCIEVNLLPYHSMGEGKNDQLEIPESGFKSYTPSEEKMETLREILRTHGLKVK